MPHDGIRRPAYFLKNYQRVFMCSYYNDGQWPTPVLKWNDLDLVSKYTESSTVLPYEDEQLRKFTETDVELKTVDCVVDFQVAKLIVPLLRRINSMGNTCNGSKVNVKESKAASPSFSSANAPLVYVDTAPLQLFLREDWGTHWFIGV